MKLLKTFSLYTFVSFLNAGVGFLVLPILTHYLSPEDYGIISLINTYVLILIPIVGLSTSSLISIEYHNTKISKDEFKSLFSSVHITSVLIFAGLLLLFVIGVQFLPQILELPLYGYWLLLPLTVFSLLQDNFKRFLATTKRTLLFSITTLSKVILEIPLTILLIVYIHMKWEGRIYAWLATVLIFSFISFFYYKKWNLLTSKISKKYIQQSVTFGTPLILHSIARFLVSQSDRLFLAKMVSVEDMGIYSVGYTVASILMIAVTAFNSFFAPYLFQKLNDPTKKNNEEIVKTIYVFLLILLAGFILMILFTPLLFKWFIDPRYIGAAKYIFWVGLGIIFWSVYNVMSNFLLFYKKSKVLGGISIFNIVISLALNYFLIGIYGTMGAAYATFAAYFLITIMIFFIVKKVHKIPWLYFLNKGIANENS